MKLPTIGKSRALIYRTARILGDINAVKRGDISKRVGMRIIGKVSAKMINSIAKAVRK